METPKTDPLATPSGNSSLAHGIEKVGSGANQAIDKISDAARPAVDRIASNAHQAVDTAKDIASHAAETLGVKAEHLKEAQTHLTQACSNYMRSNPLVSLGIAAGIGFLISRLMSTK